MISFFCNKITFANIQLSASNLAEKCTKLKKNTNLNVESKYFPYHYLMHSWTLLLGSKYKVYMYIFY